MVDYVEAVLKEIALAVDHGLAPADTIFFGGGTPSRLPAEELLRILDAIPKAAGVEITVECNPEDATIERLSAYRAGGVTRMSFGVQSTQAAVLADLGRRHGTMAHEEVSRVVHEAGFGTWNMDLIVGSRAESLDDVRATVNDILNLPFPPPHISCYVLTPEPATPLGRDPKRHPDEDDSADAYDVVGEMLAGAGFEWEEISNWAQPGHECRHNHVYWDRGNYVGFGSAATLTSTVGVGGTFARPIATSRCSTKSCFLVVAKKSSRPRPRSLSLNRWRYARAREFPSRPSPLSMQLRI
jgi:oxygen-independent coproporphyrinogen-3 oxidase